MNDKGPLSWKVNALRGRDIGPVFIPVQQQQDQSVAFVILTVSQPFYPQKNMEISSTSFYKGFNESQLFMLRSLNTNGCFKYVPKQLYSHKENNFKTLNTFEKGFFKPVSGNLYSPALNIKVVGLIKDRKSKS